MVPTPNSCTFQLVPRLSAGGYLMWGQVWGPSSYQSCFKPSARFEKKTNKQLCWKNIPGWWLTYPSEKYESQLGLLFPIYGKIKFMFQTTNQIQTCRILFIDPPWFLKMSICLVVFPCFSQLTCLKGGLGISDDGHVPSRFPKWIYPVARAVGESYGTLGTKPRRHPHSSSTIW